MKKIFTLTFAVLASISANAQFNFMTGAARVEFPQKLEAVKAPQNNQFQKHSAKAIVKEEAGSFEGNFIHSDWVYDSEYDYLESYCDVTITKEEDGTYSIANFLGRGTIKATLNAETNQLEAEPNQVLYTSSNYGDIIVVPVAIDDDYNLVADPTSKLIFSIDGDRITIDNDGIIIVIKEGEYAGYYLDAYHLYNQIDRVNGTQTGTNSKGEEITFGIAWDGDPINNGYVNIYGFCDYSVVKIVTDAETGLAYMENDQDVLYYNSTYGMFSTVGLINEDGKYYLADSTAGTYDKELNAIKLDMFGFANSNYDLLGIYSNTVITGPAPEPIVGIDAVAIENKQQNAPVYDLMGRQIENTAKGQLYIKEGRKFILR
jgi:hypothetical protein